MSGELAAEPAVWQLSPTRADRSGVFNPAMNNYKTKDGRLLMLVGVEMMRHLPGILKAVGLDRLIAELQDYPKNRSQSAD